MLHFPSHISKAKASAAHSSKKKKKWKFFEAALKYKDKDRLE